MTKERKALQSLYEAGTDLELAIDVGLEDRSSDEEEHDIVDIKTSGAKARALLAAVKLAREGGVRYGN